MSVEDAKKRFALSFQIGRLFGVPLKLHVTMLVLLLALVARLAFKENGLLVIGLLGLLLLSTVLHELGHVVAARRCRCRPIDIWLSPLGGHVRYERLPRNPRKELAIAAAGPAVNLVLAAVGFLVHVAVGGPGEDLWRNVPRAFGWVNIVFALFNLIPAFPLDGGRVLRALLSPKLGRLRATAVPVRIGRWFALSLVAVAVVSWSGFLFYAVIVALYLWIFTEIEWFAVRQQAARGEAEDDDELDEPVFIGPAPYER